MTTALARYALAMADDALVLGHRLSEWSSKAPTLEEDIALSNLGLDMLGQARLLYQLSAREEGRGRDEDQFAYFRDAPDFRNILLVEQPNGDFAATMARQLVVSAFLHPYYDMLSRGPLAPIAEIAAKAVKEMAYHVRHSAEWVIRLGDGTEESHRRMSAGLAAVWPYTAELFEPADGEAELIETRALPRRESIRRHWSETLGRVLAEATLSMPEAGQQYSGGRHGQHTVHLARMLADMQSLARAHPGAIW
jgi:ring-1,2-phenylacetyl-CoA epoxidase subunit PaaC